MDKYTFLSWLLVSPLVAGGIAWLAQWAVEGTMPGAAHCAVSEGCEMMPSNEGSE